MNNEIINILKTIETRLDNIESRLDNIESRLSNIETRYNRMDNHLDLVENVYYKMKLPLDYCINKINLIMHNNNIDYNNDVD